MAQHSNPGLYSALHRSLMAARGAPRVASADVWIQWLDGAQRRGEFRGAERQWVGVDTWLREQSGDVSREALQGFADSYQLKIEVVTKGALLDPEVRLPEGWRLSRDVDDLWRVRNETGKVISTGLEATDALRGAEVPYVGTFSRETSFAKYVVPGGDQYREILLVLPRPYTESSVVISDSVRARFADKRAEIEQRRAAAFGTADYPRELLEEQEFIGHLRALTLHEMGGWRGHFTRGHFKEEDVLLHLRTNVRTDALGKRTLFLEEVQSDWHQIGRVAGYGCESDLVPEAPFKATSDWITLAFKQALSEAVHSGCDQIAWTPGAVQVSRYDMSSQLHGIDWTRRPDNTYDLCMTLTEDRGQKWRRGVRRDTMELLLGKEIAAKIAAGVGCVEEASSKNSSASGRLLPTDIKPSGEGMRAFYDTIMPSAIGKYVKSMGAVVASTALDFGLDVPAVRITPAMREAVLEHGQAMFRRASVSDASAVPNGMSVDEVAAIAREFLDGYRGNVGNLSVWIGQSLHDLYGPSERAAMGDSVGGAFHPSRGVLTVAADHMSDRACVESTLRHELLGHFGLNTFLPEDKRTILDAILASREAPGMRDVWATVDRRYADKIQDERAEEVFAFLAERPRGPWSQTWSRVMSLVVKALRSVGLVKGETSGPELQVMAESIAKGLGVGQRSPRHDAAPNVSTVPARDLSGRVVQFLVSGALPGRERPLNRSPPASQTKLNDINDSFEPPMDMTP